MMVTLNCNWAVPGDSRLHPTGETSDKQGSGINAIYGLCWRPQPAANDNRPSSGHG